jgi:hypothetical protein
VGLLLGRQRPPEQRVAGGGQGVLERRGRLVRRWLGDEHARRFVTEVAGVRPPNPEAAVARLPAAQRTSLAAFGGGRQ